MTNTIDILKQASRFSLVLIDELGAGTDPVEGAALAVAILQKLKEKGAKIQCTTHYAELKEFAITTEGVENGCCEFDVQTLRPTYKLLIGIPGKSNAFAISKRLGLSDDIIENAQHLVSSESRRFEDTIEQLEKRRQTLEKRLKEANDTKALAGRQREKANSIIEKLNEKPKEKSKKLIKRLKESVVVQRHKHRVFLTDWKILRKSKKCLLKKRQNFAKVLTKWRILLTQSRKRKMKSTHHQDHLRLVTLYLSLILTRMQKF